MDEVKLDLTIDETNLVLEALGELQFVRVYALVGKIQSQARQQLNGGAEVGVPDGGSIDAPPVAVE